MCYLRIFFLESQDNSDMNSIIQRLAPYDITFVQEVRSIRGR